MIVRSRVQIQPTVAQPVNTDCSGGHLPSQGIEREGERGREREREGERVREREREGERGRERGRGRQMNTEGREGVR